MSIQHLNAVKAIARAADKLGAKLPADLTRGLSHLEQISASAPAAPKPAVIAKGLAQHLGSPAAMQKALERAAADLASAEATAKIHGHLAATCGARLRGLMGANAEQIALAFGAALAPDLATLTAAASRLPAWFKADQAANLDPETFTAWTQARDAYARIESASTALSPLYAGAIGHNDAIHFPNVSAAALRFAKPPTFTERGPAYAFRDALGGRTERIQGTAEQGSIFVDGLFIPTVLANAGASFEWATPTEVTQRALQVVAGMMIRERERVSA